MLQANEQQGSGAVEQQPLRTQQVCSTTIFDE